MFITGLAIGLFIGALIGVLIMAVMQINRGERMTDREERLERALHEIAQWSEGYPLKVFVEPDWKKAAELLKAGGITLDSVSAACMRHVVEGVGKIAREALEE